jgi:Spy/CpxP family protein refolding chaperone
VKHIAIEIDATDEQQAKITTLVTALAADLTPVREQMHDARQEIRELLVAETIDRGALEAVRATGIAEAERISKNLVNAAADVAEILTAEQRELLSERLKDFRSKGGGRHRG